jgi:pilus assembly protein CpaC
VKALPPDQILITALHSGQTMIRTWSRERNEKTFLITVLPLSEEPGERVIKISIEFLEVNSQITEQLGIRWPDTLQFSLGGSAQGGANLSGLNYVASFGTSRGLISLLMREGWAKLLAHPQMLVRLGEQAVFHSGGEIPIPTTTEAYGRYQRQVEWKPFGLSLRVRPQSQDGLSIHSEVRVDVSELNPAFVVDGMPGLMRRSIETKMDSQDGETVILSGLVRQASKTEKHKVPGLSSLPLLGPLLFGDRAEGKEETEAFVAMTLSFMTRDQEGDDRRRFEDLKSEVEHKPFE